MKKLSFLILSITLSLSASSFAADTAQATAQAMAQPHCVSDAMDFNGDQATLYFAGNGQDQEATQFGFLAQTEIFKMVGDRSTACIEYRISNSTGECKLKSLSHCEK